MRIWVVCLLSVLVLSGCRSLLWNPSFMPAGYEHHTKAYKSPPGPEAREIGYDYNETVNAAVRDEFDLAVRDLLLNAKAHDIILPQDITLVTDMAPGGFQGMYEFALRDVLREYGYTLAPADQAGSPALFYSAYGIEKRPEDPKKDAPYVGSAESPEDPKYAQDREAYTLVLGLADAENKITTHVAQKYSLPSYGFNGGTHDYVPRSDRLIRKYIYEDKNP